MPHFRQFASDNQAPICPAAWAAMEETNRHHVPSYGEDAWTDQASECLRAFFTVKCEVFFTFNGTAANSLALATCCRSHHSVICHRLAHIETDECGAPEFFSGGSKLLVAEGEEGRIDGKEIERLVHQRTDFHYPKPKVLSVTQATEVGTVYSVEHLRSLGALAHGLGLTIHMDGARLSNALVALGCEPADLTWRAGIDVLCFGGTKNGLGVGEAVVFFNLELAEEFEWRCKQGGQLASKMRFLSAPWLGLLKNNCWRQNAANANAMAQRLSAGCQRLGLTLLFPCQANSVFITLAKPQQEKLREKGWHFYTFIGAGGCRFMCSWDTTTEDVDALLADLATL